NWFGRQVEAGARAGLIPPSLGGIAGLVTLVAPGPPHRWTLAAGAHLGGLKLAPLARGLGGLGWPGEGIVTVALACLVAMVLAVGRAMVFAFGKNRAAVDSVSQARLAAEALRAGRPWSATTALSQPISPNALSAGALWRTAPPSIPLAPNSL